MKGLIARGIMSVRLALVRVVKRIVSDIYLDFRDFKRWGEKTARQGGILVVEKWLGLWYAFILSFVIGLIGFVLTEVAKWATNTPILVNDFPYLVLLIAVASFFFVLLYGLILSGVVVASVIRLLLWMRNVLKTYWYIYTPPYDMPKTKSNTQPWPLSKEDKKQAKKVTWELAKKGTFCFLIIMVALLWIEQNYSTQLYAIIESMSQAANFVDLTFWVIDIDALFEAVSVSPTALQVIGFIFMFVLPGIFFVLSARNLLFICESFARETIEKAISGNMFGRDRLWFSVQVLFFLVWNISIIEAAIYGL